MQEGLLSRDVINDLVESSEEVDNSNSTEVKKLNPGDGPLEVKKGGDKVSLGGVNNNTVKQGKLNQDVFDFLTNKKGLSEDVISSKMDDILNNEKYKIIVDKPESKINKQRMDKMYNDIFREQQINDTNSTTTQQIIQQPDNTSRNNIPKTQIKNNSTRNNQTIKPENTNNNTTTNKRTILTNIDLKNNKKLKIIENNDNGMLYLKKIDNSNTQIESTKKIHKDLYKNAIEKYNNEVLTKNNDNKIREFIKSEKVKKIETTEISKEELEETYKRRYANTEQLPIIDDGNQTKHETEAKVRERTIRETLPEKIKEQKIKEIQVTNDEVAKYKGDLKSDFDDKFNSEVDKAKTQALKENEINSLKESKINELRQAEIEKIKQKKIEELKQTDIKELRQAEIEKLKQIEIEKINNMTFDETKKKILKEKNLEFGNDEIKNLAITKKVNYEINKIKEQKIEDVNNKTYDIDNETLNDKIKSKEYSLTDNQIKEEIKSKEYSLTEEQIKEIETSANNKEYTPEELKKAKIDETKIKEDIIASDEKYKLLEEPTKLTPETAKTDAGYHEWLLKEEQKYITERKGLKNVFVDGDNLGHIITKDANDNLYINNSLKPIENSESFFRGDGSIDGEALMKNDGFVKGFTADKKKAIQNLPALQSFLKENYGYKDDVISEEMQGIRNELEGKTLGEILNNNKKTLTFKVKGEDGKTTDVTKPYKELTFNGAKTEKNGDFYNTTFFAKTEVDGEEKTIPLVFDKNKKLVHKTGSSPNGILRSDVSRDKFRYDNHFNLYDNFFNKNKIKLDGSEAEGVIVDTIKDIFGKSSGVEKDDLKIKSLDQIEKFRNAAIKYDEMLNPKKKGILGFASGITSSIIGRADSVEVDISEFGFEGNDNAPKVITINNEMAANLRETATKIQNASDDVIKHNYDKRKMKNNNDSFFTRKGDLDKANYEVFDDATKDIKEGIVKKTTFYNESGRHRVFQQGNNFYSITTEVGGKIEGSESGKEVAKLSHKLMSVTEEKGKFTIGGEVDVKKLKDDSILNSVVKGLKDINERDISKNSISLERLNLAKSNSTISKLTEAGLGNDGMKGLKSMAGLGIAAGILFTIKSVADASKEQRRTKQMEIMALRDKFQGNPVY